MGLPFYHKFKTFSFSLIVLKHMGQINATDRCEYLVSNEKALGLRKICKAKELSEKVKTEFDLNLWAEHICSKMPASGPFVNVLSLKSHFNNIQSLFIPIFLENFYDAKNFARKKKQRKTKLNFTNQNFIANF